MEAIPNYTILNLFVISEEVYRILLVVGSRVIVWAFKRI
jgi:hypothetical protein